MKIKLFKQYNAGLEHRKENIAMIENLMKHNMKLPIRVLICEFCIFWGQKKR